MLRMKMSVQSVKSVAGGDGSKVQEEVELMAVYGNGTANAQWSKATPSARLTATISNPGAFDRVRPGQFVFVDVTPCGKDD